MQAVFRHEGVGCAMAKRATARVGSLALAGALACLAGCGGGANAPGTERQVNGDLAVRTHLIDEGGPVFLNGKVLLPGYYKGEIAGLQVRAERLDGGAFPQIGPALVGSEGAFALRGQRMSNLMFVSAEFIHEDSLHRVRALAYPDPNTPVTIDATSTLLAASVAMAAQRRKLLDLDINEANALAQAFRSKAGATANQVLLNQPNEDLSLSMARLAKVDAGLVAQLQAFDLKLNPPPFLDPGLAPAVPTPATTTGGEPSGPDPK